jgi:hypothetical protein
MSIQRYLQQLVSDIRESARNKDINIQYPPELVTLMDIPEHLAHLPVEPAQRVHKWMKLDPETFPPADQMNLNQLIYMCNILKQLFEHYNYEVQLPHSLPFPIVYEYLIKALNEVERCNQENVSVISFCTGEKATCPFGEYCTRINDDYCNTWLFGHWWEGYEYDAKDI